MHTSVLIPMTIYVRYRIQKSVSLGGKLAVHVGVVVVDGKRLRLHKFIHSLTLFYVYLFDIPPTLYSKWVAV